jgi:hypothetical protein
MKLLEKELGRTLAAGIPEYPCSIGDAPMSVLAYSCFFDNRRRFAILKHVTGQ